MMVEELFLMMPFFITYSHKLLLLLHVLLHSVFV